MSTVVTENIHFDNHGNTRIEHTGTNVEIYQNRSKIVSVNSDYITLSNSTSSVSFGNSTVAGIGLPVGTYILSTETPNSSFLETDALYNISTYPALYAAVGNVDRSTRFFDRKIGGSEEGMAAVYGNGIFFVGGQNYDFFDGAPLVRIYRSSDNGGTWTIPQSTTNLTTRDMAYGNGFYVAVGNYISSSPFNTSSIIYTANTTHFISPVTSLPSNARFSGVAYGNGVFVTGGNTAIFTSSNVSHWTSRTRANTNPILSVAYGNGVFVCVGENGSIQTSTDNGTTWFNRTSGATRNLDKVLYNNGVFVAAGNNVIVRSIDAENWSSQSLPSGNHKFVNGFTTSNEFFLLGFEGGNYRSNNGIDWNIFTTNCHPDTFTAGAYNGTNTVVLIGATSGGENFIKINVSNANSSLFYVPPHPSDTPTSFYKSYIRAT